MQEKIFIISDIEMGRGDITDDFSDDQPLTQFIEEISKGKAEEKVALVLNGDIFDFLKMAYKDKYPRYITEKISLWKLQEVIKSHPHIFEALRKFIQNPHHSLHFVIGNHDADLVWPSLQKMLKQKLGNEDRIFFDFWYSHHDLHAEHGHLMDTFFDINLKKTIIEYKKQQILNLPWGTYACFHYLNQLKRKFPHEERLFPKKTALKQNKKFKKESRRNIIKLALKEILINPIIHFTDPTYRISYRKILKHLINHGFEVIDDEKFAQRFFKKVTRQKEHKKIFVLGHSHLRKKFEKNGQIFLMTDTWRDELDLTNNGQKKTKSYAEIIYRNGELVGAELKIFSPKGH